MPRGVLNAARRGKCPKQCKGKCPKQCRHSATVAARQQRRGSDQPRPQRAAGEAVLDVDAGARSRANNDYDLDQPRPASGDHVAERTLVQQLL